MVINLKPSPRVRGAATLLMLAIFVVTARPLAGQPKQFRASTSFADLDFLLGSEGGGPPDDFLESMTDDKWRELAATFGLVNNGTGWERVDASDDALRATVGFNNPR